MPKYSWSKWGKYRVMKRNRSVAAALPATRGLNQQTFRHFLRVHGSMVLKPRGGAGGHGVIQIKRMKGRTVVHSGKRVSSFRTETAAYRHLLKKIKPRNYIVQKRIHLATIAGRPVDFRVMVQRKRKGPWKVTGKAGKVALKGYIITNSSRGGRVLSATEAVRRSATKATPSTISRMERIALKTTRHLNRYYPTLRKVGLDMGIDRSGRVWIIEANFRPGIHIFKKLGNKPMYRKIKSML